MLEKIRRGEAGRHGVRRSSGGPDAIFGTANACPSADPLYVYTGWDGSTSSATVDGDASCAGPVPTPDVWYQFVAPEDGSFTFYTQEPAYDPFDTVLSLHAGCPLPSGETLELACSDDAGGDLYSSIAHSMSSGDEVWIRVSGYGGATGRYELRIAQARSVLGRIAAEASGASLGGVTVEVSDRSGDSIFHGTSVADGSYEVAVRRTPFDLVAHTIDDGLVTEWYEGRDCPYGTACSSPADADAIDVEGSDATGIDFTLAPAGSIRGSVTASGGSGGELAAVVSLYDELGRFLHAVSTEPDGSYRFVGVPPASYRLRVTADGYRTEVWRDLPCHPSCQISSGELVEVTAGAAASGIDFTLERLGSIAGTVRREDEGQVSDGRVYLHGSDGMEVTSDYLGGDGFYEFAGLRAGTYYVRVESDQFLGELYDDVPCESGCVVTDGTPVPVQWDEEVTGIDFRLVRKATITGTVLEAGTENVVSMRVMLFDQAGGSVATSTPSMAGNGQYTFRGLDAGTYFVKAGYSPGTVERMYADELWNDLPCPSSCDPTTGTPIVLGATTQMAGIDLRVTSRGIISGRVTRASTGASLSEPAWVRAFYADGSEAGAGRVGPDGSYEILYLEQGDYRVGTDASAWKDQMYEGIVCDSPCDRTQGAWVAVRNAVDTTGIDFSLARWGSIAGRVQAPVTSTATGSVELFDHSGSLRASHLVEIGQDPDAGEYDFIRLAPGTYYLKADDKSYDGSEVQAEVYSDLPCEPACAVTDGTAVVVGSEEAVNGIDFRLAACAHDSREILSAVIIDGYSKVLACHEIRAVDTTITAGANLTLRSGQRVVLGDGFSMEPGASLQVVIEPDWADE